MKNLTFICNYICTAYTSPTPPSSSKHKRPRSTLLPCSSSLTWGEKTTFFVKYPKKLRFFRKSYFIRFLSFFYRTPKRGRKRGVFGPVSYEAKTGFLAFFCVFFPFCFEIGKELPLLASKDPLLGGPHGLF